MNGITVTYSGQTVGLGSAYTAIYPGSLSGSGYWGIPGTYTNTPPPTSYDSIGSVGGSSTIDTITFSSPVTDPLIAFWSVGTPNIPGTYSYNFTDPFSIIACGASSELGGQCITTAGNNVYGFEGNGVIEFAGTYSSISFTNPVYENWSAITVGSETPEPSSILLLGTGLAGLAGALRRKFLRS
jgi:hypothetical protein